jgi:hypothetical protein
MADETTQKDNVVSEGGTQAGRDVHKTTIYNSPDQKESRIKALLRKCEEELDEIESGDGGSGGIDGMIEELEYYDQVDGDDGLSLKEKLELGDIDDRYRKASRFKERFIKKLTKYQFLESAQRLFALLLERMELQYDYKVRQLIKSGESQEVIDRAIYDHILSPIICELNSAEILISDAEVRGMLYYLTSKCLVDWHPDS